jgi:hypothetical protein
VSALAFPLVFVPVMAAVTGTRHALIEPGIPPTEIRVLAAYAGVLVAMGLVLSEHVLED